MSDIEIAQQAKLKPIEEIARALGLAEEDYELYGRYKAKVDLNVLEKNKKRPDGKLILVTAMTPTPAGEGKSTVSVGLAQAFNRLGLRCAAALREPSLGPVFGMKGGAAGGGYAQVAPMEDLNLHFTGDFHAIGAAHNLIAACIDNHIHHGNALNIDITQISFKRAIDMNDRALREIIIGLGGKTGGAPRESSFQITAASEIMAILCLASSLQNLKERIGRIVFAFDKDNNPLTVAQLGVDGAAASLLKEAIKPNLAQTLENTPVFIHGGPFANIAHGCNSLLATRMALKLADYTVTEAGFGADLGAEKFLDLKARLGGLKPQAVVLVATVRALKHHGGAHNLQEKKIQALIAGCANLGKHIKNMQKFGLPVVVAINRFAGDAEEELQAAADFCASCGIKAAVCDVWAQGGAGGEALAKLAAEACEQPSCYKPLYELSGSLEEKTRCIAQQIYGAADVSFSVQAAKSLRLFAQLGYGNLPICISKTQKSLSDKPSRLNCPEGFVLEATEARLAAGAGFVVIMAGSIIDMPGLPKEPAALKIDISENGKISGLF